MSFISIICLFLSILVSLTTAEALTNSKPTRLKLIHVDSIHSPFSQKNSTLSQRSIDALRNSQLRAMSMNASKLAFDISPQKWRSSFLAVLAFGSPPVTQYLSVDTGSALTWVFCPPCVTCTYEGTMLYNPYISTLATILGCNDHCTWQLPLNMCHWDLAETDPCPFTRTYGSGSITGKIVEDRIFVDYFEQDAYFGCSDVGGGLDGRFNGILGLANDSTSVLSQWGYTKFSYCFNNISDINDQNSALILGEIANSQVRSTPFSSDGAHYKVFPVRMTFQGIPILADWSVLSTGVYMDTSSTLTYFPENVVVAIEEVVDEYLQGKVQTYSAVIPGYRKCYSGRLNMDVGYIPRLIIYLQEDAYLMLPKENLFNQVELNGFCLAIVPSLAEGTHIIGILAQQRHLMSYDLNSGRIKITPRIPCALVVQP